MMRADEERKTEIAQIKMKRKEDVEENTQKRLVEDKEIKLRVAMERQTKANQKTSENEISCHQKIGLVGATDKCGTCKCAVHVGEDVFGCLLCYKRYHISCGPIGPICDSCLVK